MIIRELNQNELNTIAGGDSNHFANAGWDIGKALGTMVGIVGGPAASGKPFFTNALAGFKLCLRIDNLLRQK